MLMTLFAGAAIAATIGDAATVATAPIAADFTNAAATGETADQTTARIVGGFIAYSRWPSPQNPMRLCLFGATERTGRFDEVERAARLPVLVRKMMDPAAVTACDVVYAGPMSSEVERRLIAATRGRPILSIIERDPDCRSGAMICLTSGSGITSFRINIDAVSRSRVRIDPRVLRIAGGTVRR